MTTSSTTLTNRRAKRVRRGANEYPADSLRFDLIVALLSSIFIAGLFLDGWAHNNILDLIETFFTPYHALFYGGFLTVAGLLTFTHFRNVMNGYTWLRALPKEYMLAMLGVVMFTVGGFADFVWHETFGFEDGVEALLSPTHLLLGAGIFLIVSAPLRVAWNRSDITPESGWGSLFPAIISITLLLSLLTFFTQYSHYADPTPLIIPFRDGGWQNLAGIQKMLMPSALIMGTILLLMRRWRLPFGSLTFLIGINYTLMFLMGQNYTFQAPFTLPAALIASVMADLLYHRLQPSTKQVRAVRWFAFLVPFIMIGLHMMVLLLTKNVWWEIHMWAGIPFLSGVVGLLLSFLAYPMAMPEKV